MAPEQRIIWTALPAGIRADQLTVRLHVAPRLTGGDPPTLESFPDFQDWPATLADYDIVAQVSGVTAPITLKPADAPSSPVWTSLFPVYSRVDDFAFTDMTLKQVKSFSVGKVADALISTYGTVAANPASAAVPPKTRAIADAAWQFIDPADAPGRYKPSKGAPVTNPNVVKMRSFFEPLSVDPLQHVYPPAPDFHNAVAALAKYPSLPPFFGLVKTFTFTRPSKMPATGTIRLVATRKSSPADNVVRTEICPRTAFQFKYSSTPASAYFRTAPRPTKPEISAGKMVMRLSTTAQALTAWYNAPTSLLQFDVEGGTRKVETSGKASIGALWSAAKGVKDTPKAATLPALTTTGIRLIRNARSAALKPHFAKAKALDVSAQKVSPPAGGFGADMTLYAEDVTRGWAIDVFDESSSHWFRLCGRDARYSIPGQGSLPSDRDWYSEEGFVTTAVTQAPIPSGSTPPPAAPVNLHEGLFTWDGWSLVVQRPGSAILGLDAKLDSPVDSPEAAAERGYALGQYELPEFPLTKEFRITPGSLPRLRFGVTYRIRARSVDISGYATPFSDVRPSSTDLTISLPLRYRRFEPVPPPAVIPVDPYSRGETAYHLVLSSDIDKLPDADTRRHILPPRATENMAELHGGFDVGTTGGPPNPAAWKVIAGREEAARAFAMDENGDGTSAPRAAIPDPVPYLPDPTAVGAAFWNLPGTAKVTGADVPFGEPGAVRSGVTVSGVANLTTTKVDFEPATPVEPELPGKGWLNKRPLVLAAVGVESSDTRVTAYGGVHENVPAPKWDAADRVLSVAVPKGEEVVVTMSTFTGTVDAARQGLNWSLTTNAVYSWGYSRLAAHPTLRALLEKLTKMGANWLVSPFKTLTLTYAVKRPLIPPRWNLPKLEPRAIGQTWVELHDTQAVHAPSTAKVDVYAEWVDVADDPDAGAPLDGRDGRAVVPRQQHAFDVPVVPGQKLVLDPFHAVMGPTTTLDTQPKPTAAQKAAIAALALRQRHYIGDTRYRIMRYRAVSTSRYQEFFDPASGPFTRSTGDAPGDGAHVLANVKVLSTARPDAPKLRWIVPSFGWDRATPNRSVRSGGLRVFLDRPWYSSGDDEMLGVVFWKPATTGLAKLEPYLSWTAHDPTWRSGALGAYLVAKDFPLRQKTGTNLYLEEIGAYPHQVNVAGHKVVYDSERDLYYADIRIDPHADYWPFVRLALCRYQPNSIARCEASRVIIADFAQLAPDRTALVVYNGNPHSTVTVSVWGTTYTFSSMTAYSAKYAGLDHEHLTVCIEGTLDRESTDPRAWVQLTGPVDLVRSKTLLSWSKTIGIIGLPVMDGYRLAIREYESLVQTTASGGGATSYNPVERLVYAETLPLTPPSLIM